MVTTVRVDSYADFNLSRLTHRIGPWICLDQLSRTTNEASGRMASEVDERSLLLEEDPTDILDEFIHATRSMLATARRQLGDDNIKPVITGLKAICRSAEFLMLGRIEQLAKATVERLESSPPDERVGVVGSLDVIGELLNRVERTQTDNGIDREVESALALLKRRPEPDAQQPNEAFDDDGFDDEELFSAAMSELFKDEALGQLDAVEAALLQAEEGAQDDELLHGAFRAMHSLKGNCGCVGMFELEEVAHKLEDLLDEVRRKERVLDGTLNSVFLSIIDTIRSTVINLTATEGKVPNKDTILAKLAAAARGEVVTMDDISPAVESVGPPSTSPPNDADSPIEATRPPEVVPSAPPAETAPIEATRPPEVVPSAPPAETAPIEATRPPEVAPSAPPAETAPIEATRPPEVVPSAPPPPSPQPAANSPASSPAPTPVASAPTTDQHSSKKAAPAPQVTSVPRFIRVDVGKLDALLNQVGELISAAASVAQNPDLEGLELDQFQAAAGQLNRVTANIHDTAMSMRMVPLDGLFNKMVRIVRDLRQRLSKRVDLEISGEQTEVDKSVMESIADPLVHIIRNAVDHGIEDETTRRNAGKRPVGRVRLEARHQGSEVWIIVQDDGGGIDPAKLVESAIRKGVIHPDNAPTTAQEAYQLMFLPGFSTASAVTNVSGRGVGMDVVRREIESVRGRVEVRSEIGSGTTFTIRLPLTLAIIDAMIVRVDSSLYALPLLSVRESLCTNADQVTVLPDRTAMVRIRDRMVPIVGLDQIYAAHSPPDHVCNGILILVEDGDQAFCLRVDEMLGQRQIVIKPLDGLLNEIRGISGCSIMGSGHICLIIDVAQVAARRQISETRMIA